MQTCPGPMEILLIFAVLLYIGGALGAATVLLLAFADGRVKLQSIEDVSGVFYLVVFWPAVAAVLAYTVAAPWSKVSIGGVELVSDCTGREP